MSKEGGEVEVLEQRRKSARILALEEEKGKQKQNSCAIAINTNNNVSDKGKAIFSENIGSFLMPPPPPPLLPSQKHDRKQRRLLDFDLNAVAESESPQDIDIENHANGNSSIRNDQQPNEVSSTQCVPEKRVLECVLNILQRRDTYKIFAQPVDPKEVVSYYAIIKEPMDFGTMRTKLHEGKYTSLEQFERDVFLIFSNAMHFNSSTTIYYKEARRMQVLGQMIFAVLRVDPNKVESQFSLARGRPQVKRLPPISENKGPRTKLPRPNGLNIGASQLGSGDGSNSTWPKRGRTPIYRPWASFASENESPVSSVHNAPKVLVKEDTDGDSGYKESLQRFVKGLGPTAYTVAAGKLLKCQPQPPTIPPQSPLIILPQQPPQTQVLLRNSPSPSPSFQQRTNLASSSYNLLHNLPGRSSFVQNKRNTFLDFLNVQSPTQGNPLRTRSSGIQIRDQPKANNNNLMFPSIHPISPSHDLLGKMPLDNPMTSTTNFNIFGSSSTGNRTYPSEQNMNTSIRQSVDQHQQQKTDSNFWLASHLKVIPAYDPMNGTRFRTVDMIAEANRKGKQVVDHGDHEMFRTSKSMVRGKQPVVDHIDHDELFNINWRSRLKDFFSLSPANHQTTRFEPAYNSAHAAGTRTSNWQYQMSSNPMANLFSHETDPFLKGFGNGISSLQMPLTNNHYQQDHINVPFRYAALDPSLTQRGILPMPIYSETYSCIVHDRAGASGGPDHHYQCPDFTRELLPLKDAQQPNLALQL